MCVSCLRFLLDYGDVIYRSAGKGALERLDVLYHSAIRLATDAPYRTHHCTLYSSVHWSSLYTHRKTDWLMLIYKTLLGLTTPYLRYPLQLSSTTYNTRAASHILLMVPKAHTSLGRSSFQFAAATGTSCNKHSNWTVLSQSLNSKTQSWTLLLKVVAVLRDVLLSLPSCPSCCCLCPIMFVQFFVLLPCCVVCLVVMCVLSYIY